MYRFPKQIEKDIWYGKLSDPDYYTPSCPHLHNSRNTLKLNVYTGQFYNIKNKKYTKKFADIRIMNKLWKDDNFKSFLDRSREKYAKQFPNALLPNRIFFKRNYLMNEYYDINLCTKIIIL